MPWKRPLLAAFLLAILPAVLLHAQSSGDSPLPGGDGNVPPPDVRTNPNVLVPGIVFEVDVADPSRVIVTTSSILENGQSGVPLQAGIDLVGFLGASADPSVTVVSSSLAFTLDPSFVFTDALTDSYSGPSADLHLYGASPDGMPLTIDQTTFSGQMILDLSGDNLAVVGTVGEVALGYSDYRVGDSNGPLYIAEWIAVPEPPALWLLPLGAAAFLLRRRRGRTVPA